MPNLNERRLRAYNALRAQRYRWAKKVRPQTVARFESKLKARIKRV